ncbi:MAG: CPBP family intramembrane glutamic endopeptidase [Spirochaetota bacterium]
MRFNIRGFRRICKEIAILFALLFLPGYLTQQNVNDPRLFESLSFHLAFWIMGVPQLLIVLYVLEIQNLRDFPSFGLSPVTFRSVGGGLLALLGIPFILLPVGALFILLPESWTEGLLGEFRFRLENLEMLPIVIATFLLVGYREELFFRSYLIGRLEEAGAPAYLSLPASTLLFALGHVYQGVSGFIVALVLGLYFAVLFRKTRNIHVISIAHGLYNSVALIAYSALSS